MGTSVNIIVGSHVWLEDPEEAWIDGEVTAIRAGNATIVTSKGKTVVANLSSIHPKDVDAPPSGVDDMTKLAYLHEPGVLHNLACRFALNEIYTYTGNILIAVNPFRRLPHLYDAQMMEQYKGAPFGELSPHIFAIADVCYRAIINDHGSQSILVSGESGAGKTETTKMLMRYLAFMGGRSGVEGRTVEQQVLESNPVLEAFGNAKTVKNNNSSRFGKFVEIQFDKFGKISGAAVRTYLLERSRVCQVSDPERNYHCFYMLCAAPPEDVKRFKVGNPRTFTYLNQTNCYEVENIDDAKEYLETRKAMDIVGISQDEQDAIFRVVAAVLHLGNVEFVKGKEFDSSKLKDEKALYHLKTASELLMCDAKALEDSLCKRVIVTPDGNITKLLDPETAALSRDALSKIVYSRLFDWIVDKINRSIGQDPTAKSIIGVLDIYGFESFKVNSFEQLCINLTNEKLQQHFNQHVFKMEQEDYTREEINWSYVEFVDNQDVLDLIEKKPGGIIALLDEACMLPRSTHETFAQNLHDKFKTHKRFRKPKLSRTSFVVNHYAGDVTYQADQFLDKNKDYVIAEHQALLTASDCPFVSKLFPQLAEENSKTKFISIGIRFKQQLQSLMETLNLTEPHYIRCVKPNTVLKPGIFENINVLNQLRCGGVLEAIRISCAGYPTKRTFDEFINRVGILAPDLIKRLDEKTACEALCEKMGLKGYQIGKTKVFLRAGQMAELDARRSEVLANAARCIQKQFQTYRARKRFIKQRHSSVQIQKQWRAHQARKLYESMRREAATTRIQKFIRKLRARVAYKKQLSSAVVLQTGMRAMAARSEHRYRRRSKAATVIQTYWRRHNAYSSYKQQKKATLTLQCLWRARVARKELRKLRMDAKDAGALREAKDKLEKRVEELTWRLEHEKHTRMGLEEAKGKEIAQLKSLLDEKEKKLDEAHEAIIREKEAARIAIEQAPPVIKEVPVVDNTKLELLTNHNKELEDELSIFKTKANEFERKYLEVQKHTEELANEAQEAHTRITQLQEALERVEAELSSLECENQVFREQALDATRSEELTEQIKRLETDLANLETENQDLRDQSATRTEELTEQIKRLETDLANLETENQDLRDQSATRTEELAEQIKRLETDLANLDTENQVLRDQSATRTDELIEQIKRLETELSSLKSENQELRQQDLDATKTEVTEHIERLEMDLANLETENQVPRDHSLIALRKEEFAEQIKRLEMELSILKSENQELKQQALGATRTENLTEHIERLETDLVNLETENQVPSDQFFTATQTEEFTEQIKRLETELSSMKSENQELRQQALGATKTKDLAEHIESLTSKIIMLESENRLLHSRPMAIVQPLIIPEKIQETANETTENGHTYVEKTKKRKELVEASLIEVPRKQKPLLQQQKQIVESPEPAQSNQKSQQRSVRETPKQVLSKQRSLSAQQHANHDALIKCLIGDKRFDKKRPAAACVVYKSLLHWHSFESEKTNIFDQIIHAIKSSIEYNENIVELSYWLSATSTLLFLLQKRLKVGNAPRTWSKHHQATAAMSFKRLSRHNSTVSGMSNSSEYSRLADKSEDQSKVKASYKALLFKQHLKTCVEKIYTLIRDSLKKEISPLLTVSIQAPRSGRSKSPTSILASTMKKQASSIHWQSIITSLDRTLTILRLNYVPSMLVKQMFNQVYAFINIQLFNRLLLRRECCSLSNAEFIKAGIQELEQWSIKATEFAGNSMDELQHISQAVRFLVLHKKSLKSLEEITNELCPDLTIPQICRIGTMFWDDKYGAQGLSQDVINQMRMMMADDPIGVQNSSFLLDDDSSLPISLDEISRSVPEISIVDVEAPPLLRQNPEFHFLLQ